MQLFILFYGVEVLFDDKIYQVIGQKVLYQLSIDFTVVDEQNECFDLFLHLFAIKQIERN